MYGINNSLPIFKINKHSRTVFKSHFLFTLSMIYLNSRRIICYCFTWSNENYDNSFYVCLTILTFGWLFINTEFLKVMIYFVLLPSLPFFGEATLYLITFPLPVNLMRDKTPRRHLIFFNLPFSHFSVEHSRQFGWNLLVEELDPKFQKNLYLTSLRQCIQYLTLQSADFQKCFVILFFVDIFPNVYK